MIPFRRVAFPVGTYVVVGGTFRARLAEGATEYNLKKGKDGIKM